MSTQTLRTIIVRERPHFTKQLGDGAKSARLLLPGEDGCQVKGAVFTAPAGYKTKRVLQYKVNETVFVVFGRLRLLMPKGEEIELEARQLFLVPRGVRYGIEVLEEVELVCFFSPAEGGPIPDDE